MATLKTSGRADDVGGGRLVDVRLLAVEVHTARGVEEGGSVTTMCVQLLNLGRCEHANARSGAHQLLLHWSAAELKGLAIMASMFRETLTIGVETVSGGVHLLLLRLA